MDGPARVLVIEDDPPFRELLVELLSSSGYAVTTTESVLGATTLVKELHPRAIVLDLGLPYRSGASLLGSLKADPSTGDIPVIVVSGLADALPLELEAKASAVFSKPLQPQALLDALERACAEEAD